MIKIQDTRRSFWSAFLLISVIAGIAALYQSIPQLIAQDINIWRSKWTLLLASFILNVILGIILLIGLKRGMLDALTERLEPASTSRLLPASAILIFFAAPALFWFIRLEILGSILPQLFPALWIFIWLSLLSALALKALTNSALTASLAAVILFQGVIFRCWSILNVVTDFPFTLEYSETSRFYYGSLVFSQSIYGMDLPLSTLHPSRYLLQAIPFMIPDLPLWAHRLWQALLWIILTGVSALLLGRRMNLRNKYLTALVAAWGFVYFLQGSVYYHLQVCVIILLLGVSTKRPMQTLLAVVLSSLWAGISRVNWFPVPAMLAIAIYLLEEPVSSSRNLWEYLRQPVAWTIAGLASALASQTLYVFWSGNVNNASDFASSFTSDLIWSRLLPNITYPPGVLPGILIVSAPLLIMLVYFLNGRHSNWHVVRPLGLLAMLLTLFLGGLVVSTKIGGGGDIHNMDAFMALLAVVVSGFFANQVVVEKPGAAWGVVPNWTILLAALIPILFSIQGARLRFTYDHVQAQKDFTALQAMIADSTKQDGEILFISERHLITFQMVDDVSLTPEYEVVTLMEMAMSGDQAYLDRFHQDLASHRFSMIVTRNQRAVKKENEPFAEENNVWIDAVTKPLVCYYERKLLLESSNTLILVPAKAGGNCP